MFLKQKKIMKIYAVAAIVGGLALAVWRAVLLFRYSDPYSGEIAASAKPMMTAFGVTMLVLIVALASSYFVLRKTEFLPFSSTVNQISVFACSFCGSVFFATAVILPIRFGREMFSPQQPRFFFLMQLIAYVAMLGAAAYFLLSASARRAEHRGKKLLSFFPTIFALAYLAASYINSDYLFGDPARILCNVSLVALLLFFLLETGNATAKPKNAAWFAVSLVALLTATAYFLPLFAGVAFWEIEMKKEFFFEVAEGGALLYILAVIYTMIDSVKEKSE